MSGEIAFLGLGAMGFGMATNLVKRGYSVTGFDVYGPTLERFLAAGGKTASTPRDTVKGAQYIIFMVATAAQILSALFEEEGRGAVHEIPRGSILILCSTGPPEHSLNVRALLDGKYGRRDVEVVDAPVSGGTIRATDGTLTILASGPESSLVSANKVLEDMAGGNLHIVPGGLGAGTKVKMVHQVLAGIHIAMTSEAMGFAAALGFNTKEASELLRGGEGSSWMFENRTPHMLVEDERVYSALNIIVKDVGIVTAGGRNTKFPLFLSSVTEQVLATGVSLGLGLVDDARLVGVYLPQCPGLVLKLASSATPLAKDDPKLKLVEQIMAGVHLAAAVEAMSLGKRVGLEMDKLFEIISTAAGSSWMFRDRTPQLLNGKWTSIKTVENVIAELTEAVEEANRLKYPLHLAGTALQLFQLAEMRGLGKAPDLAVCRIWDNAEGTLFPRVS